MLTRLAKQRGVILVISLIMLVLMTLFVVSSINLGNANLRLIAALQSRRAAEAAAQQAIQRVASNASNFITDGSGTEPRTIDINGTDVLVATPVCLQAIRAAGYDLDNALAPQDTFWDVRASATEKASRAKVVVHEGFHIRLPRGNCPGETPDASTSAAHTRPTLINYDRRGRMLYAMDASEPNAPRLIWKKGCPEPSSTESTLPACDAGYGELGRIWSQPTAARIRYKYSATAPTADRMVLIFGAGYDPATDDPIPPSGERSSNTIGRGIYVVDMADGSVLWRAGPAAGRGNAAPNLLVSAMTYSIPSDVAAIDRNADDYVDRAYVGDTGGNLWRLDLADPYPGDWTVNKLASLGYAQSASAADRRKFYYRPSVVAASDRSGPYDALLIGSGDRAHTLNGCGDRAHPPGNTVANRFYMLKDRSVGDGWGLGRNNQPISVSTITDRGWRSLATADSDLADFSASDAHGKNAAAVDDRKGWFISLADSNAVPPVARGEKTVGRAITVAGITHFATYRPTPDAAGVCADSSGEARSYSLHFASGGAIADQRGRDGPDMPPRFRVHTGAGLLPSPVFALTNSKATGAAAAMADVQTVCFGTVCAEARAPALWSRIRSYAYTEGD